MDINRTIHRTEGAGDAELPPSYGRHQEESVPITLSSSPPGFLGIFSLGDNGQEPPRPTTIALAPISSISLATTLTSDEEPPKYIPQDPEDCNFTLLAPFIHSTSKFSALTPRYQLSSLLTSSTGKPYRLRIRRLNSRESRRISLPTPAGSLSTVEFDNERTLYLAENVNALSPLGIKEPSVEIRGCKARTLRGHIQMQLGSKVPKLVCRFWHMTRNEDYDAQRDDNDWRRLKIGFHRKQEWNRSLLFAIEAAGFLSRQNYEWKDESGKMLASETGEQLDIDLAVDSQLKDALLACWASRCWILGGLQ